MIEVVQREDAHALNLQREKGSSRVDQINAGQPVLDGYFLCSQLLLHSDRISCAAFHSSIIGNENTPQATNPANAWRHTHNTWVAHQSVYRANSMLSYWSDTTTQKPKKQDYSWTFLTCKAASGRDVPIWETQTGKGRKLQKVLVIQEETQTIPDQQLPVSLRVPCDSVLSSPFFHFFSQLCTPIKQEVRDKTRLKETNKATK